MFRRISLFLLLSFSFSVQAQDFTQEDAKAVIDTFFEGFHKGDTTLMRSVLLKEVPTYTVYTTPNGEKRLVTGSVDRLLEGIAQRPAEQVWKEELLDYSVQIDGDLAQVWTPYRFYLNGSFSHCGANAFTLIQTNDGWRIQSLIDTRRKGSCEQQD